MSKNAIIGIIVLCFVSTFMTMVYQYASRSYLYESNPHIPGGGGHAVTAHQGGHEGTATPGPAVETPMSVETPAAAATETAPAPTATETPGEAPVDTPSTPVATPVP